MQSAIQSSSYALHEQIPALAQELRSCSIELASCKCAFRCVQREVTSRPPPTPTGCVSCPIKMSRNDLRTDIKKRAEIQCISARYKVVGVAGFELATPCSQSRCANRTALHPVRSYENRPPKGSLSFLSGRLDSNQRPPTPEAGALTGLRYTPNKTPILVRAHKDTPKNRNNQIIRKKTTSPLENMPTERYSTAKKLMLKRFNSSTASLPRRFTNAA